MPRISKRFNENKRALVDIDETICFYPNQRIYTRAKPNFKNINKINQLKREGWHITYWTGRGGHSHIDYTDLTKSQLKKWGCLHDNLILGYNENPNYPVKPSFDLVVDDKAKRIEEL